MSPIALVLVALTAGAFALVADEHGVRVSQRVDTRIIDFFADGTFDAPPERVLEVMLDYEHSTQWQKSLGESRVLERSDDALEVYQRLALPVVADRDYTLRVTWGEHDRDLWIRFALANDHGPPVQKGVVRVPVHEGSWRLTRSPDGQRTFAHYEVRMDLGGSIPSGAARRRAAANVPSFFEGLRQRLRH